jgi:hypothetical protein
MSTGANLKLDGDAINHMIPTETDLKRKQVSQQKVNWKLGSKLML